MFGHVTVRYRREPIMLLYSLWLAASPFSSGSSVVVVLIGVGTELNHVKLLHQVLHVLGLMYEGTLLRLLDLDT
jgi:uncharacterized membrane protein YccF (DUF307 family)